MQSRCQRVNTLNGHNNQMKPKTSSTHLKIGASYKLPQVGIFPESRCGATVTITDIDDEAKDSSLSVSYNYVEVGGRTGAGNINRVFAEGIFKNLSPSIGDLLSTNADISEYLNSNQREINEWAIGFVGLKNDQILELNKAVPGIFGLIARPTISGVFGGWRDHKPRMRIQMIRSPIKSTEAGNPCATVIVQGVPIKDDGTPFSGAVCTVELDILMAADTYSMSTSSDVGSQYSMRRVLENYIAEVELRKMKIQPLEALGYIKTAKKSKP